jgi:hypothetical protein
MRADSRGEGGRGEGKEMRPCGHGRPRRRIPTSARTHGRVRSDASASARTHGCVRAIAPCFTPGNFQKDATVRPSHGRPCGHRPSVRKRLRDNHGGKYMGCSVLSPYGLGKGSGIYVSLYENGSESEAVGCDLMFFFGIYGRR